MEQHTCKWSRGDDVQQCVCSWTDPSFRLGWKELSLSPMAVGCAVMKDAKSLLSSPVAYRDSNGCVPCSEMEAAGEHQWAEGPEIQLPPPNKWGISGLLLTSPSPLQVVQRIKAVETETRLLVVDKETDEYLCSLRLTCTEEMAHSGILLGSSISPSKSVGSDNGEVWKPQLELNAGSLQRHSHSFSSHGSRKVRAELVA